MEGEEVLAPEKSSGQGIQLIYLTLGGKCQAIPSTVPMSEVSHTLSEGASGTRHDLLLLLARGLYRKPSTSMGWDGRWREVR